MAQKCLDCSSPFDAEYLTQLRCESCEREYVNNFGHYHREPKPSLRAFAGDDIQQAVRLWWLRGKSIAQIELLLSVKLNLEGVSLQELCRKLLDGDYSYKQRSSPERQNEHGNNTGNTNTNAADGKPNGGHMAVRKGSR